MSSVHDVPRVTGALKNRLDLRTAGAALTALLSLATGCGPGGGDDPDNTGRPGVHMAELSADLTRVYLSSTDKQQVTVVDALSLGADSSEEGLLQRAYVVSKESDEVNVIDLRTLEMTRHKSYQIIKRVRVGKEPTHMSVSRDGRLLAVMNEEEGTGAVSFIDTRNHTEIKRLGGFYAPHFMRFSHDGRYGYVANINAHHLTRVDLDKLEIDGHIPLDGFDAPPNHTLAPEEGGFGDAQIDSDGVLFSAHRATGRVLVYDTNKRKKVNEVRVGNKPWIAYAEHPFRNLARRHLVTNFGDKSVSVIDAVSASPSVIATLPGDEEAYGVNYSSLTPNKAFVMNRIRQDIAVVDTETLHIKGRIPVGGNTETAATTADGKYIIAAVSSANRVVVVDAETEEIVKTFDDVGSYPWSVTIPNGQNYCH
jgi:DNA-binding beta-propeller fold protein YncE